jgi:spore maturation protein CgeB
VDGVPKEGDLVWIGNWGDDERTRELHEFLIEPVRQLGLTARVYGVRYPEHALRTLAGAGIEYGGWLPNYEVTRVFARFRMTVHVPRRPYVRRLPGIPTIRPFEALACGIPLVSAPWDDRTGLFTPGHDYLLAPNGAAMTAALARLRDDAALRERLAASGRATILASHTCAHRVDQLLAILADVSAERGAPASLEATP